MATTVRENNFDESQGPLKFYAGPKGYVYYKGISPAQAFPASGKAAYTGTWDFVTNAVQGRDRADFTSDNNRGPGDRFGATSADDSVNNDIAATTFAALALFGLPAVAALSAYGMASFIWPSETQELFICADNDDNRTGMKAAHSLAVRAIKAGIKARIWQPETAGFDALDELNHRQDEQTAPP